MTTPTAPSESEAQRAPAIPAEGSPQRFVVRSPILLPDRKIYGYELLYRDGLAFCFAATGEVAGSAGTVDSSILMGFETLGDGAKVFLPCSLDVLLHEFMLLLPPNLTVVELGPDVPPWESAIAA